MGLLFGDPTAVANTKAGYLPDTMVIPNKGTANKQTSPYST